MWQDFNANTSSTRRPMYGGHSRWTAAQSAPYPTREAWGTSWWGAQPSPQPPPSQPEPVPSGRHPRMHPTGAKHQAGGGRTSCLLLDLRTCLFREGMRLEAEGNHPAAGEKYKQLTLRNYWSDEQVRSALLAPPILPAPLVPPVVSL